ncbi:MAG TPA: hypothetical protein VFU43_01025 [Streptosporangiaceae bacterium]|nr:hypothetical protein [Streptosporangiaceae bacterium]
MRVPRRPLSSLLSSAVALAAVLGASPAGAPPAAASAASAVQPAESRNMVLIAHNDLNGSGNLGEGYAEIKTRDGRRVLYAAHESGPRCLSVLDVTDPRAPGLLGQIDVPGANTRCNSLDLSGGVLAVANQVNDETQPGGITGLRLYDVSGDPAAPEEIGFFDTSGPFSRGVHYVWFADGRYAHISTGMPDFQPRRPDLDDQLYVIVDLENPRRPVEAGRWWWPGTRVGDSAPLPTPNAGVDSGCRSHNTDVFPDRPDRAYVGYIDCGLAVLDISRKNRPRPVALLDDSPPAPGFTHTLQPIRGGRDIVTTHEAVEDNCTDGDKRIDIYRHASRSTLTRIATLPAPDNAAELCARGGRFGAHNIFERTPDEPTWWSDDVVIGSFFNGGVRAYDVSDPRRPREAAYYVPAAPAGSPAGAIQINDVYVDDRGVIFAGDRFAGGLYVLRSPVIDRAARP